MLLAFVAGECNEICHFFVVDIALESRRAMSADRQQTPYSVVYSKLFDGVQYPAGW
eukprot:COSAG06_NODE_4587_length_4122_cov_2.670147_5_plen_56_part_00